MLLSTTLSCYFGSAVVFAWIALGRSQTECSPSTLTASCRAVDHKTTFLETDIPPSAQVTITCDSQTGTLTGWSHAPGTDVITDLLDTSPSKYMVNGNTLTITNINRTDEGVYRCIYEQGNVAEQCIFVYGRAMFVSCPNHFDRCPGNVSLSVEDGDSVRFDATVTHTPGGSCGFQQQITTVQLMKLNPEFGVPDELLLSCATSMVTCSNSRVSLSRGNDPGYEFVFTLNDVSLDGDGGMYRVDVHLTHPATNTFEQIMKSFDLQVIPQPTSRITPETNSPTTTATGPDMATDTTEQPGTPVPRSSTNQGAIIGALVSVVLIVIAVAVILAIIFGLVIWRSKHTDPPDNEKASESHIIAQEENRDDGRDEKVVPNQTALDRTQELTIQEERPPPYYEKGEVPTSEELNRMNNNEEPKPMATEPSSYDNRFSFIESDFHLSADTNLNSTVELVTICEGDEAEQDNRI